MLKVLLLILSLLSTLCASEDTMLRELRDKMKKAAPFRVAFVQKVMDGDEVLDEAKGELVYSNQLLFKLTYKDPDYKVALFKDDSYLFYDEENEQVTTTKNMKEKKDFLWRFIFDESMSRFISTDKKKRTLHIIKKDENTDITVFLDKKGMPEKVIHKGSGNTNIYLFSNYIKKIVVPEGEFEFTFPEGVEIIEM